MEKTKTGKTRFALVLLIMAAGVAPVLWLQEGCQGNYPPLTAMVVTATPALASDVISNFNSGSVSVNSTLKNVNGYPGSFSLNTYGGIPANTVNNPFVLPNPGDGSLYAIRVFCHLSAAGGYEADQLNCNLSYYPTSRLYNASPFTGIQFSYYLGSDDTNSARTLGIPIDLDMPSSVPGGICTANCYNPHVVNLPSGPTNTWQTVTYTWSQFSRPGFVPSAYQYSPLSNYLTEVLFLQWSFASGAQGSSGSPILTQTDVWIDNVKFLP